MGVMINMLRGNEESTIAFQSSVGKIIKELKLDKEENKLIFIFEDNIGLKIYDDGQSCCEYRYMRTDDNLQDFVDSKLLGIELKNVQTLGGKYGEPHEIQFLEIKTSNGIFVMSNHNEHNGYYGGFSIICENFFNKETIEEIKMDENEIKYYFDETNELKTELKNINEECMTIIHICENIIESYAEIRTKAYDLLMKHNEVNFNTAKREVFKK